MLSIGLIGEHPVFSSGFDTILRDKFQKINIHVQTSLEAFYQGFEHEEIKVIVLNLYEKGVAFYLQIVQRCSELFSNVPIIILSENAPAIEILKVLKFGARGYLLKQDNPDEISKCIEVVINRKYYLNEVIEEKMLNQFIFNKKTNSNKISPHTEN